MKWAETVLQMLRDETYRSADLAAEGVFPPLRLGEIHQVFIQTLPLRDEAQGIRNSHLTSADLAAEKGSFLLYNWEAYTKGSSSRRCQIGCR